MLRHSYIQKINMQTKGRTTPILYLKGGIKLLVSLFFNHELVFDKRYLACALLWLRCRQFVTYFWHCGFLVFVSSLGVQNDIYLSSICDSITCARNKSVIVIHWCCILTKYIFSFFPEKSFF